MSSRKYVQRFDDCLRRCCFQNVKLKKSVQQQFPKYRLYLYGEGRYARSMQSPDSHVVSGVPVLFIPGSAGSHEQVRSLASVALRRAEFKKSKFQFDYFAVDLNEEHSGLYGGVLMDQTMFVAECMKKIRSMYLKTSKTPKSIVLVGHSMGGLVARGVFMLEDFDPTSVHTIVTQATPHQAPVLSLDNAMANYYHDLDEYWRENIHEKLSHVVLMSIGGGYRDIQVRNGLTTAPHYGAPDRILSTTSMSVPMTWLATDHRAVVWCKQLVLVTQRALFDMVNSTTQRITDDVKKRSAVLEHHFLHHPGSGAPLQHPGSGAPLHQSDGSVLLQLQIQMLEVNELTFTLKQRPIKSPVYIHMDVSEREGRQFVATCRQCDESWILGCTKMNEAGRCLEADQLSGRAQLLPPEKSPRKVIHLKTDILKNYRRIILVVPKTEWEFELHAELFDVSTRLVPINVPAFFQNFPHSLYKFNSVFTTSERGAMFYNFTIPYLETVRQAYKVRVKRKGCYDIVRGHEELMTYHTPWASEDVHVHGTTKYGINVTLKYQSGRPSLSPALSELHLYPDPDCLYTVEMMISITEMLGQLIRYYATLLPGFVVANLLLMLSWQLSSLETVEEGNYWYLNLLRHGTHPKRFLPFVTLPHILMSFPDIREWVYALPLPIIDGHLLEAERIWDLSVLPIVFFLSNSITAVATGAILILVEVVSTIWGALSRRCLSPELLSTLARAAEITGLLLALLAVMTSSGGLGLALVAAVNLLKVVALFAAVETEPWLKNCARVQFLLFMLSLCMAIFAGPSLVTWYRNRHHDILALPDDPWRLLGCGYCVTQIIIALVHNERVYCHSSIWTYKSIHLLCVLVPFYAIKSLHHLPYLVTMVTALLALRCLRSVTRSNGRRRESVEVKKDQ